MPHADRKEKFAKMVAAAGVAQQYKTVKIRSRGESSVEPAKLELSLLQDEGSDIEIEDRQKRRCDAWLLDGNSKEYTCACL